MKINYLIFMVLLLAACRDKNGKSDAYGNFETEPVLISSEMPGKILAMNFSQGDKVKAGSLLAVTDTSAVVLQTDQIKSQMAAAASKNVNAKAQTEVYTQQIANLTIDRKRLSDMFREGASTQKQLDDLDGQVKVLEKQIEAVKTTYNSVSREIEVLESQLAIAKNNLTKCFIYTPVDGTVLEKYVETGEITGTGKSIAKIADLDELILRVYVSGGSLSKVKSGEEAEVLIDEGEKGYRSFTGKVTWISPEAEFTPKIIQTREERVKLVYAVKIAVKNDGSLKIGMPGEARFK
jgi:HlyD family secretion protein